MLQEVLTFPFHKHVTDSVTFLHAPDGNMLIATILSIHKAEIDYSRLTVYIVKNAVVIFQIVDNTGVVTQLFLVKLENDIESLQRMSLNENEISF